MPNAWNHEKKVCVRERELVSLIHSECRQCHLICIADDDDSDNAETNIKLITLNVIQWSISMLHWPTEQNEDKNNSSNNIQTKFKKKKENIYYPLTLCNSFILILCLCLSPKVCMSLVCAAAPIHHSLHALTHCTWMNRCYYNKRLQNVSW